MKILIIDEESLEKRGKDKFISQINAHDIHNGTDLIASSDLVVVQLREQIKILKSRSFTFRQPVWDYNQLLRVIYVNMDQSRKFDIIKTIVELSKQLPVSDFPKLITELEKAGFERS